MSLFNVIWKEVKRIWFFVALAGLTVFVDPVNATYVLFGIGVISTVIVFAHLVRKILQPYVDLHELYNIASQQPVPAAIVFTAFMYFICTILNVSVVFLK